MAMTVWIPLPLLDSFVETRLRRSLTRKLAERHGVNLPEEAVSKVSDLPGMTCLGCLLVVPLWIVKKLIKWAITLWTFKEMFDLTSDVAHRALMLEEALHQGWLPDKPDLVRSAMDQTLDVVRIKPLERMVQGTFRGGTPQEQQRLATAAQRDRERQNTGMDTLTPAVRAAAETTGLLPEVLHTFRAEMGRSPLIEPKMGGVLEAAEVLPSDAEELELPREQTAEEAVEVPVPEKPDSGS